MLFAKFNKKLISNDIIIYGTRIIILKCNEKQTYNSCL